MNHQGKIRPVVTRIVIQNQTRAKLDQREGSKIESRKSKDMITSTTSAMVSHQGKGSKVPMPTKECRNTSSRRKPMVQNREIVPTDSYCK